MAPSIQRYGALAPSAAAMRTPPAAAKNLSGNVTPTNGEPEEDEAAIGDDDADAIPTVKPPNSQAERQHDRHIFSSWLKDNAEKLIQERAVRKEQGSTTDVLSLKQLMDQQEGNRIIGSPRDYQMELYERAKTSNTIAVLDTGSGKTLIAVMLLRHVIDQELEDRAAGCAPRISFFLVDKVALVYQQHSVLKANLDQPTEAFSGAMGTKLWAKESWLEHFKSNRVIVCTAMVLHHCLSHAFITIDQINLLIFDEAHHAKGEHPYAQIIRDFYLKTKSHARKPRIFGMTASPVDSDAAGEDLMFRAKELERLLHATIATALDLTLFQGTHARKRIQPEILLYPPNAIRPQRSELYKELFARYCSFAPITSLFVLADDMRTELGSWASDNYWSFVFSETQAKKREAKLQRIANNKASTKTLEMEDAEMTKLQGAYDYVQSHHFGPPLQDSQYLSTKVLALLERLQSHFERPNDHKCLVFVERKATARVLHEIVAQLGGPNIRSGVLIGAGGVTLESYNYSHKEQALTMMKFRKGELNCLFSTSVGEEGIDVPECNIVIRFDPAKTMIQYVQSRGRARKQNSKFVLMQERGSAEERYKLQCILEAEFALQTFCKALPADRLVDATGDDSTDHVLRKAFGRVYVEPATEATLNYEFAPVVLQHFASRLPHEDDEDLFVTYVLHIRQGRFLCEVILPVQSPITSAIGRVAPRKMLARQSAAFEACLMLIKGGYLDKNFVPTYTKQLPAMRNARLAITSKKQDQYEMISKPTAWELGPGTLSGSYYIHVITLNAEWDRPVRPFLLITRSPLPPIPSFPIYRLTGEEVQVLVAPSTGLVSIDESKVSQLTGFTLSIFKDIFNKTFENVPAKMSYWLAPLRSSLEGALSDEPFADIDWEVVKAASSMKPYNWTREMGVEYLMDKFLIDPFDGGRRLFPARGAPELRPTDPVPAGTTEGKHKKQTIIEYSVKLWTKSRAKASWDEEQPVIEAEKVMHRLNILATPTDADQAAITRCFVILEPFRISLLPSDVASMGLIFPAIIHRIESYMIALDFATEVGVVVDPDLALEALTKDSDNTDERDAEQVNFQRGMGNNYERLEFIGDCFLKMATTIATYVKFAGHDEDVMHVERMLMLCNMNLCDHARQQEWYKYIRGKSFSRRTWYPHGIELVAGKGFKTQEQQATQYQGLGDKTIADICEALIGATLITHLKDPKGMTSQLDQAVFAVTRCVVNKTHDMKKWSDYYEAYEGLGLPKYQTAAANASNRDLADRLYQRLGYRFKYPRLLRSAFTHPSLPRAQEGIPSYQRLEFLGDALLDLASVDFLQKRYKTGDPGWLTEHKMAMVSNKFQGALGVKLGFHRHLRHGHAGLESQIRAYVEDVEEAERLSNGHRDYWNTVKDPPKCLSDIVESYVGAVFVDSEFDYAEVQRFFEEHVQWFFEDMSIYDTFANRHPVTRFYTLLTEELGCTKFRMMAEELPTKDAKSSTAIAAVIVHGNIVANGQSQGGKYAKIKAATKALDLLEGLPLYEFRRIYKQVTCDCTKMEVMNNGDRSHAHTVVLPESIGTAI